MVCVGNERHVSTRHPCLPRTFPASWRDPGMARALLSMENHFFWDAFKGPKATPALGKGDSLRDFTAIRKGILEHVASMVGGFCGVPSTPSAHIEINFARIIFREFSEHVATKA